MAAAVEMLLLPAWAAAAAVGGGRPGRLLLGAPGPVVLLTGLLFVLAALVGGETVLAVLEVQALGLGFVVLVAGVAVAGQRAGGERFGQFAAAALGWLVVGGFLAAGPVAELLGGPVAEWVVGASAHASPLVAAEHRLGFDWLHAGLTYRLSPLGESYALYVRGLAAWKTALGHAFVGSALLVFAAPRGRGRGAPPPGTPRA